MLKKDRFSSSGTLLEEKPSEKEEASDSTSSSPPKHLSEVPSFSKLLALPLQFIYRYVRSHKEALLLHAIGRVGSHLDILVHYLVSELQLGGVLEQSCISICTSADPLLNVLLPILGQSNSVHHHNLSVIIRHISACLNTLEKHRAALIQYVEMNNSIYEELNLAGCKPLAKDKLFVSKAEALLVKRLNSLLDGQTPYNSSNISWESLLDNDKENQEQQENQEIEKEHNPEPKDNRTPSSSSGSKSNILDNSKSNSHDSSFESSGTSTKQTNIINKSSTAQIDISNLNIGTEDKDDNRTTVAGEEGDINLNDEIAENNTNENWDKVSPKNVATLANKVSTPIVNMINFEKSANQDISISSQGLVLDKRSLDMVEDIDQLATQSTHLKKKVKLKKVEQHLKKNQQALQAEQPSTQKKNKRYYTQAIDKEKEKSPHIKGKESDFYIYLNSSDSEEQMNSSFSFDSPLNSQN